MIVHVVKLMHAADGQYGMITRNQALDVGVDSAEFDSLVAAGFLQTIIPGVARVRAGGRHPFPRQFARWLMLQPHELATNRVLPASGVLTGATALRIHKVIDLPGDTEIIAMAGTELAQVPDTAVSTGSLEPGDWSTIDGLPVAVVGHAFADTAASGRLDYPDLGRIADRIMRAGLADEAELGRRLEFAWSRSAEPDLAGRKLLEEFLAANEAVSEMGS